VKVKLPTEHLEQDAAKKVYQAERVPVAGLAERVRHIMQATFDGKRIVVFSGGGKKGEESIYDEARAIRDGGGNGSIIGRNSFQRPKADAVKFLQRVMDIYAGKIE
jgi:class I fructose-bisphosphate aldolase